MSNNTYVLTDDMIYFADKLREMTGSDTLLSFPDDFLYACEKVCGIEQLVADWAEGREMDIDYVFSQMSSVSDFFSYNEAIRSICFPDCTTIGSRAFLNCTNLISISAPVCVEIRDSAFAGCTKLSTILFSTYSITKLSSGVFQSCKSLRSVFFPNCSSIGESAFYDCEMLSSVILPSLQVLETHVFEKCYNLQEIYLPMCRAIKSLAFGSCSNLQIVSIPACADLYQFPFRGCSKLESVFLSGSKVVRLDNTRAFDGTAIHYSSYLGYFGSIFVPMSLLALYKSESRWSYYRNRIVGV